MTIVWSLHYNHKTSVLPHYYYCITIDWPAFSCTFLLPSIAWSLFTIAWLAPTCILPAFSCISPPPRLFNFKYSNYFKYLSHFYFFSPYFRSTKIYLMRLHCRIVFVIMLVFSCNVIFSQAKMPMHIFELNQTITDHLLKTYPGCQIRSAWKTDTSKFITYEVRLVKSNMEYAITYDKEGRFLRKQPVSPVIAEIKPVVHRRTQKSFLMKQLDSLQVSDSLILKY